MLKSSVKQLGNKSVIIVKPNGQFTNNGSNVMNNFENQQRVSVNSRQNENSKNIDKHTDNRNSLRKVSTLSNTFDNKENKNYMMN